VTEKIVWTEAVPAACVGWFRANDGRTFTTDPQQAQRRLVVVDVEFTEKVHLANVPGGRVMYACSAPECKSNMLVVDGDRRDEHRAWHQRHEDVRSETRARSASPRTEPTRRVVKRNDPRSPADDDLLVRIERIRSTGMSIKILAEHLGGMPLWRARHGKSWPSEIDQVKTILTEIEIKIGLR